MNKVVTIGCDTDVDVRGDVVAACGRSSVHGKVQLERLCY